MRADLIATLSGCSPSFEEARQHECEIVAFPEMCISGYILAHHRVQ